MASVEWRGSEALQTVKRRRSTSRMRIRLFLHISKYISMLHSFIENRILGTIFKLKQYYCNTIIY